MAMLPDPSRKGLPPRPMTSVYKYGGEVGLGTRDFLAWECWESKKMSASTVPFWKQFFSKSFVESSPETAPPLTVYKPPKQLLGEWDVLS